MFRPKPLFVVPIKKVEKDFFVQSLVVSLSFLSVSKVQQNKTMKVATFFHIWWFNSSYFFALYNGTAEQASPYIMLR
jgi:hypothetical protein